MDHLLHYETDQQRAAILREYLASITKGPASTSGPLPDDEEEAVSTDSDVSFEELEDGNSSLTTASSLTSHMSVLGLRDLLYANDIASDDSAFSSEDEFSEPQVLDQQRTRRLLVLGRPPATVLRMRPRQLVDMQEAYMVQLDHADLELEELTGVPREVIVRRVVVGEYKPHVDIDSADREALVTEMRSRSRREIVDESREDIIKGLTVLAQALFRRERQIKRIYRERGAFESKDDEDEDMLVDEDDN